MTDGGIASFPAAAFDAAELAATRRASSTTVSVCLPARDEAPTVGRIVDAIRQNLVDGNDLVDEIVVVDDHSTDDTAAVAAAAGATVVDAAQLLTDHGTGHGKGEALWKSLHASTGDVVVWIDADIEDFDPYFVVGLLGPLLTDPSISFVKGHYRRPELDGVGGGRVTELTARPLLSQLFPGLAEIAQPLAGEYAGRRSLLERLPFVVGYGVDVALLIDAWTLAGADAVAQADLGVRRHRNRPLSELGPQALAVSQAILDRAGIHPVGPTVLRRPGLADVLVVMDERPPLAEIRTDVPR